MKTPEKLNAEKARRNDRAMAIREIEHHLETSTVWGKYKARPSQVRAAARKLFDVLSAQVRREKKQAAA
jgi:hypothetical protein